MQKEKSPATPTEQHETLLMLREIWENDLFPLCVEQHNVQASTCSGIHILQTYANTSPY